MASDLASGLTRQRRAANDWPWMREDVAGTGGGPAPAGAGRGHDRTGSGVQTEKLWSGRQRGRLASGRWVHDHGSRRKPQRSLPVGRVDAALDAAIAVLMAAAVAVRPPPRACRSCSSFSRVFWPPAPRRDASALHRSARRRSVSSRALRSCSSRSGALLTACSSSRRFCFLGLRYARRSASSRALCSCSSFSARFLAAFSSSRRFRSSPSTRRCLSLLAFLVLSLFARLALLLLLARRAPWPLAPRRDAFCSSAAMRRRSASSRTLRSRSSRSVPSLGVLVAHRDASAPREAAWSHRAALPAGLRMASSSPISFLMSAGCFAHLTDGLAEPRGNFRKHVWPRKINATKRMTRSPGSRGSTRWSF